MANVLSDDKKQQVLALGRLGWSLRKIEEATGVRRETAGAYLRAAGVAVRAPRQVVLPAKPATAGGVSTDSEAPKPASAERMSTDSNAPASPPWPSPGRAPAASACEPYREIIEQAARRGRNAVAIYQDLVNDHGFAAKYASVRRFVARLRGRQTPDAHSVIFTEPGQEGQVDYGEGPMVRDPATSKYRRDAAVRLHARVQPQVGAPDRLQVEHPRVGRAARARLPPPGVARLGWSCSRTSARAW
jgi:hypothetical protein